MELNYILGNLEPKVGSQYSGESRISRRGGHGPRKGGVDLVRGCRLPRQLHFENFVCQNEIIWTLGGGRAPGMPPLDPPMQ